MAEFLLGCKGEKNLPKKSFSVFYISLGTFNRFYKVLVSSYLIGFYNAKNERSDSQNFRRFFPGWCSNLLCGLECLFLFCQ